MSDNLYNNDPGYVTAKRNALQTKFNNARVNLLLVFAFTVVNIILLISGSSTYFLFSASIPYFIADMGMLLSGKYPPELYVGELEGAAIFGPSASIVFAVIAIAITGLYLVCWYFSKKKHEWFTVALVLFIIDTVGMFALYGLALDSIVDILFHGYVIWSLVNGVKATSELRKLPPEAFAFNVEMQADGTVSEAQFEDAEAPKESSEVETDSEREAKADTEIPEASIEEKDATEEHV
jgi:hypothetical protein